MKTMAYEQDDTPYQLFLPVANINQNVKNQSSISNMDKKLQYK